MAKFRLDHFTASGVGFTQDGHWEAVQLITKHFGSKVMKNKWIDSAELAERARAFDCTGRQITNAELQAACDKIMECEQ